jgi:tetratricopeptide (TPR) repeat protein
MARSARSSRSAPREASPPPGRRWLGAAIAIAGLVLVTIALALAWRTVASGGAAGPIVLVSIDTLRADRLPLYGYARGRTPAIDALARESVVFERAYAHAPQTLPSHTSMLAGELPFEHGVRDNVGFTVADRVPLVTAELQAAGYRTGGFVSAFVLRSGTGIARGFDTFDDRFPQGGIDRSPGQIQRSGPSTLEAATAWMNGLTDDRFFLFLHLYEPHTPYTPPARFRDAGDPYDGEIAAADAVVGSLVGYLKRRGWYESATIIVTSDHGEGLGDHGEQEHGLFVYDESIRVPLVIRRPDGAGGGRRVATPVQHIDLPPTIRTIAGLAPFAGARGRDLAAVLAGSGAIEPQAIYAEALYARYHFGWSELFALTDERYRYISAPRAELYDLERDPDERRNIAGDRAQTAAAMRSALDRLIAGRSIDAPGSVTADERERLAALGYVGARFTPVPDGAGGALPDPKDMAPVLRRYRETVDLLEARRFNEAAASFAALLRDQPDMTDVWAQYAAVLSRLGRHEEALDAFREMVRLKPDEPTALLGAASALVQLGRYAEAREHALIAVDRSPATAHQTLALIAVASRDFDEARRRADLAASADPGLPMPEYVAGLTAYTRGQYVSALPLLQRAHSQWSSRTVQIPDLRFYLGDTLARLERYPEAERVLLEELQLFPASVRARSALAMLYAATGREADVTRAIDEMLAASPGPSTFARAAELWEMFGRPDRAREVRARRR